MRKQSVHHRRRGFSLLELVLVMGLISLMMGYVLPSFWNSLQAEALPSSAREFRALLYHVRSRAMMDGRRYRIRFPAEDEFSDHPERRVQPLIEREDEPMAEPGTYYEVNSSWAREPVLRHGIRCVEFKLGMPVLTLGNRGEEEAESVDELDDAPELDEDLLTEIRLVFEPDGSSDWATFTLAELQDPEELEDLDSAPLLNIMLDGRTGQIWIQQPLLREEAELLLRENGSHILHMDRINAKPITEDNILRLRDLL